MTPLTFIWQLTVSGRKSEERRVSTSCGKLLIHSALCPINNLSLTRCKILSILQTNLENIHLHPGWQIMLMACMIHYCGVLNFLTEFTDQLYGSKELAFHPIKAETYENDGLLLGSLHQMLNFQPWPIYIFISHAAFGSLFVSISTSDTDKGRRVLGLPLVRRHAKCTAHSLKATEEAQKRNGKLVWERVALPGGGEGILVPFWKSEIWDDLAYGIRPLNHQAGLCIR